MTLHKKITASVVACVRELYGSELQDRMVQLQETRPEFEGQLTLVVFPLLKISRKAPEATAEEIGAYLAVKCPELISRYNVVKGFLNMVVAPAQWIAMLEEIRCNPRFGFRDVTEQSPLVMIEYSSPNTNKPLHLGHVRNNLLGWALANIMEANGNRVVKTNIVNVRAFIAGKPRNVVLSDK